MDFIFSIVIGSLFTTLFFVLVVWVYFLLYLIKSLRQSPILGSVVRSDTNNNFPKVSIVVPARNEEKYIGKCLTSLLEQDYPTFEIVAVNDLSSDMTREIMNEYRVKDSKRISVINIERKPDDWVGKNWACYQGYLKSSGDCTHIYGCRYRLFPSYCVFSSWPPHRAKSGCTHCQTNSLT